jgi:hypothetical protein
MYDLPNDYRDKVDLLQSIARWISEAASLRGSGMPTDSFTLTLHGTSPYANQQLANILVKVAKWDEGYTTLKRRMPKHDYTYLANPM